MDIDDAADEMGDDFVTQTSGKDVIQKQFALRLSPVVIPLIDRNDELGIRLGEEPIQIYLIGDHIFYCGLWVTV